MPVRLDEVSTDVRESAIGVLRLRRAGLIRDLANGLSREPGFETVNLSDLAGILVTTLANAVKAGWVDTKTTNIRDLARFAPRLSVRHLIRAVHHAERTALGELSLDEAIGSTGDSSRLAAQAISAAAIELTGVIAETQSAINALRDPLTTLMSPALFDFVLGQELIRARRHRHGVSILLFDIDGLSELNRMHGRFAENWLFERLGILARQFFRTHDSVARHASDSIAVLLPETPFEQAGSLAQQFSDMIRNRLVLVEHQTDASAPVTVSAAAVGTDLVDGQLDAHAVLGEAEAAVVRAQMNGGNRMERVGLLPTSVTIPGAAILLGTSNREVIRLLRTAALRATRRARHLHIERDLIDDYRRRG